VINEMLKNEFKLWPTDRPTIGDRVVFETITGQFKTGTIVDKGDDSYGSNQRIQILFDDRSGGIQTLKTNCYRIGFEEVLNECIENSANNTPMIEEVR
jgi:hypothetical protein